MRIAFAAVATPFLLASCSQEDTLGGDRLPEGKYPLQISSVEVIGGGKEQPWSANAPQTRVAENADGSGSVWQTGDKISVQIGNGTPGTYTYQSDGSLAVADGDQPAYWASTASGQTVKAWHTSSGNETVNLSDQTNGLAYIVTAQATANFNEQVSLDFSHALAKVRVVKRGSQMNQVDKVQVYGYTSCSYDKGTVSAGSAGQDWLKMKESTYQDGTKCWEVNVVPGAITLNNFVRLNESSSLVVANLAGIPTTLEKGKVYTIKLSVGATAPDDAKEVTGDIKDNGKYVVYGDRNTPINITGGTPTLYLENANIAVGSGNSVNITGGNPTIHVIGESKVSSGDNAGIFVAENSTVTIKGNSREDKLTVKGGEGSSGIGGYVVKHSPSEFADCGNIIISNVSVTSYGSRSAAGKMAPGIGSVGDAGCGTITVDNAEVHAYGINFSVQFSPGIGCGYPHVGEPTSIPVVTISNDSEVHAHRGGGNADYIGWAGDTWNGTDANSTINFGGGTCKNSTIYCYTGNGNTVDKTMVYDANGTGTEK